MTEGNTKGMMQDNTQREHTDFDFGWDWDTDDFDVPQPRITDDPALPVTLEENLIPIDRNGVYVPNHLDDRGTLHFFAAVDVSDTPNFDDPLLHLGYFRVTQTGDGRLVHDSHPVMPLERGGASPFPLPALQLMLEDGDLDNAQELAHLTAQSHGLNFPDPAALPELNTGVDYRFVGGSSDDGNPTLEAVKGWREGNQDHEARLTIASYGMSEELAVDLRELNELRETQGLEAAMNLAEGMAAAGGNLESIRDDPRLFTDGPPDPFTTNLERERAEAAITREQQDDDAQILAPEAHAEQFREKLANSQYRLLEPVDPTVNYSFEVVAADPWTLELAADKWWIGEDGRIGNQAQTLQTYSLESYEWERETEREIASMDREDLYRTYQESGLEAAMRQAESLAVENDELDPNRADGRLFQQGPPDRFTTLREAELAGLDAAPIGESRRDITHDDTDELPAVSTLAPDSWDALIAAQTDDEPEPERHYWQMHYRPVETPEGERLGTALFVTEFPQLPPDFDDYVEENGMDDSIYPTEARTVEMAHFASDDDARKFEAEFRSYLVPELLGGPELAPEVAKVEGLSGEWEAMNYNQIVDYMSGNRTVVREESDWHLHNPNAEREAEAGFDNPQTGIDF
ncbi:MAG: hypothetical protein BroJett007_10620 [Chloroflexota bacterium]|nr:MAG: hypothetical protein BroJett007_10620 [Chloroflexota bacterium]